MAEVYFSAHALVVPQILHRQVQGNPIHVRSRGHLSHWERKNGVYFLTFRLFDSLPRQVVKAFCEEYASETKKLALYRGMLQENRIRSNLRKLKSRLDRYLDAGYGACYMRDPRIASIVAKAIEFFHEKRYRLFAWCVMPNHVHVVFQILDDSTLAEVLHSWKSYSSKKCNELLGRTGPFWQPEYFDYLVRDQNEFERITAYVMHNPASAGLTGWPWVERLPGVPSW